MDTPKLIRRNQKTKALAILENAKNIKSYTLSNGFMGKDCDPIGCNGRKWLVDEWLKFDFARLEEIGEGSNFFHLTIHSNCWYEFQN